MVIPSAFLSHPGFQIAQFISVTRMTLRGPPVLGLLHDLI
jgi:hypothetical protein